MKPYIVMMKEGTIDMFILYPQDSLRKTVMEMRRMGDFLMPYTYPLAPKSYADDISPLKLRSVVIDGYPVFVQYNKGDYDKYYLESVEIIGQDAPFLPFFLVCKIAKAFLGEEYLAYVSFFVDNRMHYCWTMARDKEEGGPMPGPYKVDMEVNEFEGFEYSVLPTGGVEFH